MVTKSKKRGPYRKRTRPRVPLSPDALAFTVAGYQRLGGPGKSKVYELAKKGVLVLFKDQAGRTMITGKSARALLGITEENPVANRDRGKPRGFATGIEIGRAPL